MTLKLYNTLTRKKELFTPIDKDNVRMYVCGPTVYDYAHIGNARPIIVFDVLYRLLCHIYGSDHVTYARNITDVDDKINARAAEEGVSIAQVTERTTKQFHQDIAALGVLEPNVEPRATDHVDQMIEMIAVLIEKGHAYEAEGHVLFHVPSMPDYGKLSNRTLDEMIAGARVEVASYKKDPTDFILWKPSTGNAPGWDSPWGFGRPGWHIECSAMSEKYLGKTFDIHGGGIDLQFPHHENEIAQSRCAHDTKAMANVWMHNGFLQVEGEKMSKSLGNFITINQLLQTESFGGRKWPGEVLRLAMLMTHYRRPIDFTVSRLEEAYKHLRRMYLVYATYQHANNIEGEEAMILKLSNDLDTSAAVTELFRITKNAWGVSGLEDELANDPNPDLGSVAAGKVISAAKFLGILNENPLVWVNEYAYETGQLPSGVAQLMSERQKYLEEKNWGEADRIRDELADQGVLLRDKKDTKTGKRITTWEIKR